MFQTTSALFARLFFNFLLQQRGISGAFFTELDRLGRNKKIIKDQLLYFREKEITVRVLDVPTTLIDFSNYGELGKSIMDMVNNLLIEVLSTLAETEMLRTKKRQAEGIAAARARGIKLGRPKKVLPPEFFPIYDRWIKKEITAVEAFHTLGISKDTFTVGSDNTSERYKMYQNKYW